MGQPSRRLCSYVNQRCELAEGCTLFPQGTGGYPWFRVRARARRCPDKGAPVHKAARRKGSSWAVRNFLSCTHCSGLLVDHTLPTGDVVRRCPQCKCSWRPAPSFELVRVGEFPRCFAVAGYSGVG